MKTIITIAGILYASITFAQNCTCEKQEILSEIIHCDTIRFDNKAKLYWNFNCDSSWLTFESPKRVKEIMFSLGDGLHSYTGRLGYDYTQEYKHTFLIRNFVISGCCDPPEYFLFDKKTGNLKKKLGRVIFYGENKKLPFIIGITNSNYNDTGTKAIYNSLTIYNIDKNETHYVKLPKGELENQVRTTETMFPEHLFEEPVIQGKLIKFTYHIRKAGTSQTESKKIIIINLEKYSN